MLAGRPTCDDPAAAKPKAAHDEADDPDGRRRPAVSQAITRDLRRQYGADYRVVPAHVGRRGARRCSPSSRCATGRSR